jgi:N-acetylated-alpha-linked acidic dipeptidase
MRKHTLSIILITLIGTAIGQDLQGFYKSSIEKELAIEKQFLEKVDFSRFITHLEQLTKEPHVAGSPANERVQAYMAKIMQDAGFESKLYPYDLYMSKEPGESLIEIVTPFRKPINQQENIIAEDPFSDHPNLWKGWNGYSGSGDVTAEIVYANYGTKADFEKLKALGVNVKGKIVLARYGANFRGYKARFAEENGAAGLIIFTDPADNGYMKGLTYPDGPYFNESTIQRGSILTVNFTGDPLTPYVPALPLDSKTKISRINIADADLPKIPVTPIGYGAAKEIMELMSGKPVPSNWQGGLPFTYRLEGGAGLKVRLKVDQKRGFVRANNVVGMLRGSEFPDEWIILGCHFDAWGFGATDPNSGTAMLLSLSETLGKMAKEGKASKRSILIGHWDAEEHGVLGSSEWVEQLRDELKAKSVAYMNFDGGVSGRNFGASAAPTLKQLVMEASKVVEYPDSSKTIYQMWAGTKDEEPSIGTLGGGSDHIAFYMHAGIPSLSGGAGGPTPYHSNYDDSYYYKKFVDPSLKMGGAVEQLVGIMTLRLANAETIPYDVSRYGKDVTVHFQNVSDEMKKLDPSFKGFIKTSAALEKLKSTSASFETQLNGMLEKGSLSSNELKEINKELIGLEKSWLDEKGMYFGDWYKSLYVSTDPFSGYASWVLPGIRYDIEINKLDRMEEWDSRYATALNSLNAKVEKLIGLIQQK